MHELRALSAKGYLQDAFYILGHIKNERMQAVAETLSLWDRSGELAPFLDTLETLLK